MLLLEYAGFLRYSEIANLKMENIKCFPSYIVVNIVSGKTDVYRRGNNVGIAKTNSKALPRFLAFEIHFFSRVAVR